MERLIRSAGYEPRQRTNLYERFVTRDDTAAAAARWRHALMPENRALASPLQVVAESRRPKRPQSGLSGSNGEWRGGA